MLKKNIGFWIVFSIFIVTFIVLGYRLEKTKEDKLYQETILNQVKASQSSVIVQQASLNEAQKFSGKLVSNANELSYIDLNWNFSQSGITKSELYLNNQLLEELSLTQTNKKVNIVENNLTPENNEFTLMLYTSDQKQIPSKISVSAGYVYDMNYAVQKINDVYHLEFSYVTNIKSPVSLPKLKESSNLELNLKTEPTYTDLGNYRKIVLNYTINHDSFNAGNHRVLLLWNIESINYEFTQVIEFTK